MGLTIPESFLLSRRRANRMSNCHLCRRGSLIGVAPRVALRAPALRAATALTRPNRPAQRLPSGRHAVPTAVTVGPTNVVEVPNSIQLLADELIE
jgi:hypothetical protein